MARPSRSSTEDGTLCFKFLLRVTSVGTPLLYTTFQGLGRELRFTDDGSRVSSPRVRHDVSPDRDELRSAAVIAHTVLALRTTRGERGRGRADRRVELVE